MDQLRDSQLTPVLLQRDEHAQRSTLSLSGYQALMQDDRHDTGGPARSNGPQFSSGARHTKFAASLVLPLPVYSATCG